MNKANIILAAYALAACANLSSHLFELVELTRYTKPMLMPLLLLYVHEVSAGHVTLKTLILAGAIIFSWGGDLALMFGDQFFLAGVGLFFVAQLLYIWLFSKAGHQKIILDPKGGLALTIYGIGFVYLLAPMAGDLLVPIILYGTCLLVMAYGALTRRGATNAISYRLVLSGAVLFVLSDSVLGFNKFVGEIQFGQFWIMATYSLAQFFIARGILLHTDQSA